MSDLYFNMKFASKQFERQSKKSEKEQVKERTKIKQALEKGNVEAARIHSSNVIRLKNEANNFLRLSARLEACASRVKTAEMMGNVVKTMGTVVKGMDKALEALDTEKIGMIMDKFEEQVQGLDVTTSYMESSMNTVTATNTPEDEVNSLMAQVVDENNLNLDQTISLAKVGKDQISEIQAEALMKEVQKQREKKKALMM
ncbi:predicted protein [Naegleria gruberi]|uniref:Predicted protein n=1 Tax=Naegleria gruberi TaxID=5762 RepID=D2VFK6_NAEGR|nr:uncharacterized protein NAEGRDRAFT_33601 [Naegleria gruberi]EFC44377.1 predicted protein [Naegleria gruberi]|eukprot:XP_002677121.1 predicted protein [Naegleria gruberi strain NEG-M]